MSQTLTEDEYERLRQEEELSRQRDAEPPERPAKRPTPPLHRLLPASVDAEAGVISSLLLQPTEVWAYCIARGVNAAMFHSPGLGVMFDGIRELLEAGKPVDIVTLTQYLHDAKLLDAAGGASRVSEMFTFLPTAANAEYYLDIVAGKFGLREIISTCTTFASRAYEEEEAGELLHELEVRVSGMALRQFKPTATTPKAAVMNILNKVALGKNEEAWGLSTGFPNLDAVMRGLRKKNMIAIGGATSAGKTALALNFIHNLTVERKIPALLFSAEMSTEEVIEVLLQIGSGVNVDAVVEGRVSEPEMRQFTAAASKLAEAPLVIRDESDLSITEIRSIARVEKPRLIMMDYAQLFRGSKTKYDRRDQEIAEISRDSKKMAGEMDATVFLLTQLNDDGKVAESRTIAKDANQLLIVEDTGDGGKVVKVCKQRRGPKQEVFFRWIGPAQKFLPKPI